jgi:TctA family transporter
MSHDAIVFILGMICGFGLSVGVAVHWAAYMTARAIHEESKSNGRGDASSTAAATTEGETK